MANETEIKIKITGQDDASPALSAAMDKLTQAANGLSQAQVASGNAAKAAEEHHEDLKVGLINLTAAFSVVHVAVELAHKAFEILEHQLEKAVEEALAAEKANNRLTGALVSTGQYTEKLTEDLKEHADALEASAGANGELVKNMIATGIQMGLSVEKAKEMEEAARKLAAATGKDVNEAFGLLQRSLSGQSRGLAMVLPQIKEFGEAQLKQGAAIDMVSKSLDVQYKLYQQSLPAALDRAKVSVDNVYKAFGLIITQSEFSKIAVNAFTAAMQSLEHGIKAVDKWLTNNKQTIMEVGAAMLKVVEIGAALVAGYIAIQGVLIAGASAMGIFTGATSLAAIATGALGAAAAVLFSPITLTVAAVAGLTAALYVWPGLFDVIIGSFKTLIGVALLPFGAALGGITVAIGATAKALGADWGKSVEDAGKKLIEMNVTLVQAGVEQVKYGAASVAAGKEVQKTSTENSNALKKELQHTSDLNAAAAQRGKMYAGFNIGTEKQREALKAQVQDRDKDNKDFADYLEAKKRIAISKQEEQQMELAKVQAKATEGSGPQGKQAASNVAVDAEIKKQAELDVLRQKGLISLEQYNEATLASDQRAAQAELEFDLAHQQARADMLGESDEGYAAKQAIAEERFQLELQQKIARAQQEDATDLEIQAIRDDSEAAHRQQMLDMQDQHLAAVAAREEISGATVLATQQKYFREQEKAQSQRIKNLASGVTLMEGIQEGYNKSTQALGDALVKNEKITASKYVGIFLETLGRKIQMDGFANLLMGAAMSVMLNPQGPALMAAGGAEIAGGTAIARAGVGMQGGQADEGMDSVPGSLSGKSFILSQGERVVQPSANRDLKEFLSNEKNGGSGGSSYNITLNYSGAASKDDASKMADIIIDEIRSRSERGSPIMNERGLVKA